MAHEEKNIFAAILVNIIVNSYVIIRLNQMFASGVLDGPDALMVWARMVLWVIPGAIVCTIILTILMNILFAIAQNDHSPDFTVDERDRMFQRRGMIVTMAVAGAGFIASIIALAVGWQALPVFIIIYFSFALGDFAGNIVKLFSYRTGG